MWEDELKLKADEKFVEYDDKIIAKTKANLAALVKSGAPKAEIEAISAVLA